MSQSQIHVGIGVLPEIMVLFALVSAIVYFVARRRRVVGSGGAPVDSRYGLLDWLTNLLIAVALVALAICVGMALALMGLGAIALLLAISLVVLGLSLWRRAALPLAVIAGALAISAAVQASSPERLDRSAGVLVVQPRFPTEIRPTYHRGAGSVLLDLRNVRLLSTRRTKINVRSDLGQIVVALPATYCVDLRVRMTRLPVESLASRIARKAAAEQQWVSASVTPGFESGGFEPLFGPGSIADQNQAGRLHSGLIAYGQAVYSARPDEVRWERRADRGTGLGLDLNLEAAADVIVRDYPPSASGIGPKVRDNEIVGSDWPNVPPGTELPEVPIRKVGDIGVLGRPLPRADMDEGRVRAMQAAGNCATRDQLESHEAVVAETKPVKGATARSGLQRGASLVVNGLGKYYVTSYRGDLLTGGDFKLTPQQ